MSPGAIAIENGKIAIAEGKVDVMGNCCFCQYCDCVPLTFEITFSGVLFCPCTWDSWDGKDRVYSWSTSLNATHTLIRSPDPGGDCTWKLIITDGLHVTTYNSTDNSCSGGIYSEKDLDYEIRLRVSSSTSMYLEVSTSVDPSGDSISLFAKEITGILGDADCTTTFGPYDNEFASFDCGTWSIGAYDGTATFEGLV